MNAKLSQQNYRVVQKWLLAIIAICFAPGVSWGTKHCSKTAVYALSACVHEVKDDFWTSFGNCQDLAEPQEQYQCKRQASYTWAEGRVQCRIQYNAHQELCKVPRQDPYDPRFDSAELDPKPGERVELTTFTSP